MCNPTLTVKLVPVSQLLASPPLPVMDYLSRSRRFTCPNNLHCPSASSCRRVMDRNSPRYPSMVYGCTWGYPGAGFPCTFVFPLQVAMRQLCGCPHGVVLSCYVPVFRLLEKCACPKLRHPCFMLSHDILVPRGTFAAILCLIHRRENDEGGVCVHCSPYDWF